MVTVKPDGIVGAVIMVVWIAFVWIFRFKLQERSDRYWGWQRTVAQGRRFANWAAVVMTIFGLLFAAAILFGWGGLGSPS